jgi:hypothetical protein
MMKKILSDIQQKLTTDVSALQYVNEDWGQLNNTTGMQWPCALIDASEESWNDLGKKVQQGIVNIRITVGVMQPGSVNDITSYETFDVLQAIHKSLQGFVSDVSHGPLTRVSSKRLDRDDNVRAYEMIYAVQVMDDSAMPVLTKIKPAIEIEKVETGL